MNVQDSITSPFSADHVFFNALRNAMAFEIMSRCRITAQKKYDELYSQMLDVSKKLRQSLVNTLDITGLALAEGDVQAELLRLRDTVILQNEIRELSGNINDFYYSFVLIREDDIYSGCMIYKIYFKVDLWDHSPRNNGWVFDETTVLDTSVEISNKLLLSKSLDDIQSIIMSSLSSALLAAFIDLKKRCADYHPSAVWYTSGAELVRSQSYEEVLE